MENLRHSLKLGLTAPVYLFWGDEPLLMEDFVQRLIALVAPGDAPWNLELFDGESCDGGQVIAACRSGAFLAEKKLVLVRNARWLRTKKPAKAASSGPEPEEDAEGAAQVKAGEQAQLEAMIAYLQDPDPATVLLLTVAGNVNRGSRAYKAAQKSGRAVEFTSPKGMEREKWLRDYFRSQGLQASPMVCSYISLMCAEGLSSLKNEADKLVLYCGEQGEVSQEDAEAVVSQSALADVFRMADQVTAHRPAQAVAILRRLLRQGEKPYALIGWFANHFRIMLAAKDLSQRGAKPAEIASTLGVNPYFARRCLASAAGLNYGQLLRSLDLLLKADWAGKTGQGDAAALLELAILKICAL